MVLEEMEDSETMCCECVEVERRLEGRQDRTERDAMRCDATRQRGRQAGISRVPDGRKNEEETQISQASRNPRQVQCGLMWRRWKSN